MALRNNVKQCWPCIEALHIRIFVKHCEPVDAIGARRSCLFRPPEPPFVLSFKTARPLLLVADVLAPVPSLDIELGSQTSCNFPYFRSRNRLRFFLSVKIYERYLITVIKKPSGPRSPGGNVRSLIAALNVFAWNVSPTAAPNNWHILQHETQGFGMRTTLNFKAISRFNSLLSKSA